MAQLERDIRTETVSSPRGWTAVRVTHQPSGMTAERARSDSLRSAVQAQRECIDELRDRLARGRPGPRKTEPASPAKGSASTADVGGALRAELDALAARVARVEEQLHRLESRQRRRSPRTPES